CIYGYLSIDLSAFRATTAQTARINSGKSLHLDGPTVRPVPAYAECRIKFDRRRGRFPMTPIIKVDFEQLENPPLAGQVALVTGSSRGIGRAVALRLAGMGCAVAICGRDKMALASVEEELRSLVTGLFAQVADV